MKLTIIPQKFSFQTQTIRDGRGNIVSSGITATIEIDAFKADKEQVKKDLTAIFTEVLEYFD